MSTTGTQSRCPYCMETIARGAVICKHCGTPLKLPKKRKKIPFWRGQYMLGVYSGIVFMILMIILWNKIF